MNITILSNRDLASNFALNHLLPALHGHHLTVYLSSRLGKAEAHPQQLRDLALLEHQKLNQQQPSTRHPAGVDQPRAPMDAALSSGKNFSLLSFDALSAYACCPITEFDDINTVTGLARLRASKPALIISLRYGVILKAAAIGVPTHGVINLHSGRLPTYRGVMASFWGMLNGENQLGTTLHYIHDIGIDTGSIIDTTTLAVNPQHSYLWHALNLYPAGCALIAATVARLTNGEPIASYAQPQGGNYYTFPTGADLTRFTERGLMLFDEEELTRFFQRNQTPEYTAKAP
jgi:methionyl-tRNA formyltransferase